MFAYLRWIWWTLVYAFAPPADDLETFLQRGERTKPSWWKFRPCVHHNEDGHQWEVWFEDEQSYTERGLIQAEIHRDVETHRIVGLTVWDESLKAREL